MGACQIEIPTTQGYKIHTILSPEEFDLNILLKFPTVRKRSLQYLNVPITFDIETTNIIDTEYEEEKRLYGKPSRKNQSYAFIYQWQMCFDYTVVMGRTVESWLKFMVSIADYLHENRPGVTLPIYVHYLSFEFQFIKQYFKWERIFAREKNKPIRASSGCFEFRCSYFLSNMSLAKFCENTQNVTYYKLEDTYDYRIYRFPDTPLTTEELQYCFLDVYGLAECIREYYRHDSAATIPMTSTSFVRRECREAMKSNRKNRDIFKNTALTLVQYRMMREAFRGGDTHANFMYSGELLEDLESFDISSSYPAVMMTKKFPMSKFIEESPSKLGKISRKYAWIARIRLENVHLKKGYYQPYIDIAHCRNRVNILNDNGRVLKADQIDITITDVDWEIISETYDIEHIYCAKIYLSKYDYLPKELREMIKHYFVLKSELKGNPEKEYEYIKAKNKLNSIYGMMVTDIIRPIVELIGTSWEETTLKSEEEQQRALDEYYSSRNSFLAYQWGVWVTAHARYALRSLCDRIRLDVVYQDTDSLKIFKGHREKFEKYNQDFIQSYSSLDIKPEVTVNGKTYIMGIWDYEGSYKQFITYGAKKYCYTHYTKSGELETVVTVSGLNKEKASSLIQKEGIESFKLGKIFYDSGRTTAIYGDTPHHTELYHHNGTLHRISYSSYIAVLDTTYELGVTDEYKELLNLISRNILTLS